MSIMAWAAPSRMTDRQSNMPLSEDVPVNFPTRTEAVQREFAVQPNSISAKLTRFVCECCELEAFAVADARLFCWPCALPMFPETRR